MNDIKLLDKKQKQKQETRNYRRGSCPGTYKHKTENHQYVNSMTVTEENLSEKCKHNEHI